MLHRAPPHNRTPHWSSRSSTNRVPAGPTTTKGPQDASLQPARPSCTGHHHCGDRDAAGDPGCHPGGSRRSPDYPQSPVSPALYNGLRIVHWNAHGLDKSKARLLKVLLSQRRVGRRGPHIRDPSQTEQWPKDGRIPRLPRGPDFTNWDGLQRARHPGEEEAHPPAAASAEPPLSVRPGRRGMR